MCGIVGANASRNVNHILLEGLKRLEYRGYDSAGIAVINADNNAIERIRTKGKVAELKALVDDSHLDGHVGIAHTRWATHGEPTEANAHPHFSSTDIAIVHNGIIENHEQLRQRLINQGYNFASQTDTEVIVHLLHHHLQQINEPRQAIRNTVKELEGAYALGILFKAHPKSLYTIRRGSPLVIGVGIDENFIASDPLALLPVTQRFIYLEEEDFAEIKRDSIHIWDKHANAVKRPMHTFEHKADSSNKGHYRHFMQKEIFEQPDALSDTLEGHIRGEQLLIESFGHNAKEIFSQVKRVQIVACGTSYHAGMVARYWLESLVGIATQVEIASEIRYRQHTVEDNTLFIALSQSGETADTLAALRLAKQQGYLATLGVCNVPQSSLTREADMAFMMRAGTEIGVAATKTFSAQLVALLLLTLALGQTHKLDDDTQKIILKDLQQLPKLMQRVLNIDSQVFKIAKNLEDANDALFLGRGIHYPIAMEGALKLKEISYLHAEAYPAGELKHGPLALVDHDMPVIILAPKDHLIEKLESNMQEVLARGGQLIVIADKSLGWQSTPNMKVINMPVPTNILSPILYNIPLQLLAYHVAVLRGTDVDQPRNLAKSVTVE